jgi:hypothetical protein
MMKGFWGSFVSFMVVTLLSGSAMAQSCSGSPWTNLMNGNPADATQVMHNFTCVLTSPNFSGNVGIGTTSPTSLLQVGSSATRGTVAIVGNTYVNPATLTFSDASNTVHPYTFYQGLFYGIGLFDQSTSQWRMAWADNGNVGIGTLTPSQALEVNGQIKVDSLASASSTTLCINANVISSCSSSLRYKENVRDADFGLKDIEAMRPVLFKWKGRQEEDLGLVAEEVAKINPLFVTSMNGKIEGVKYAQLTAVVVNAIKELKTANDLQAAEVARLNAKIEGLEHRANSRTAPE